MSSTPERRDQTRPAPVDFNGALPVAVARLSDELADQIRRFIVSEGVSEGARLPSERELSERFGASRPTVSQALRTLSLMGLVEIRRGSGAYVLRRPETMVTASVNLMLDLDEASVGHLMQTRLWLETLGVQGAAEREPELSDEEKDAIMSALRRLEKSAGSASEWIAADTVFHATLVRDCGNPYLAAIYESVHTSILAFEYKHWVQSERFPPWLRNSTSGTQRAIHEPIARAVIDRDPEAAKAAVLAHHEVMLGNLAQSQKAGRGRR